MKIEDIALAVKVGELDFWETLQKHDNLIQRLMQDCNAPELIAICTVLVGECIDLMPPEAQLLFLKYFVQGVQAYNSTPVYSLLGAVPEGSA